MSEKNNILELFPTPVYTTVLSEEYSTIIPFLDQEPMYDKDDTGDLDSINYGFRSKDSYLLNQDKYKEFGDYILSIVKNFSDMMGIKTKKYKFSQSWISHKTPNQHHAMHSHSNSIISGVFYYGHFDENTPIIEFHKPKLSLNMASFTPDYEPNPDYPFSYEKVTINPSPGLLLLFPSYLLHSVPLNTTNRVRKSLAFNCVPTQEVGSEFNLTELKF